MLLSTTIGQSQGQGSHCERSRVWGEVNDGASEKAFHNLSHKHLRPLIKPRRFTLSVFPFGCSSQPCIHWSSWVALKVAHNCFLFLASCCPTTLVLPRLHKHRANRIREVILLLRCFKDLKIEKSVSFVIGAVTSG